MKLLDKDPLTGVSTLFDWDATENRFRLCYQQDAEPVIEANKRAQLDLDTQRKQAKEGWAQYASIPAVVQYEWLYKYGVNFADRDHWPAVMKLLNSPDYRYLKRTTYYHDR